MVKLGGICLVALVIAGCTDAASDPAKKAPLRPPPPPPPTVLGTVSVVISGPGRAHAPEENTSSSSAIACLVVATNAKGDTVLRAKSGELTGGFAMSLPDGAYKLSFADCVRPCCSGTETTLSITAKRGARVRADWTCQCQAK
jgi:hypothetical protein